jgi:hypothetical protein
LLVVSDTLAFTLPVPDTQIGFATRLLEARRTYLQDAMFEAVSRLGDVRVLDHEAHVLAPAAGLRVLAARGLRAEVAFALPTVLRANPRLIGYYRLVLGFSRKFFYGRETGLSAWSKLEDGGPLSDEQDGMLDALCITLNRAAGHLLEAIARQVTADYLDDLSLLTLGPQLRGGWNVALGSTATRQVLDVISEIIGDQPHEIEGRRITLVDATGRRVLVRFGTDPDIEVVSVSPVGGPETPMLAIEIKGGTDVSNVHNRLGEAEKSHLKAKRDRHFTDLWTIVNVRVSESDLKSASPTTTMFFELGALLMRQGATYALFRDLLLQKLRLPDRPDPSRPAAHRADCGDEAGRGGPA